ncbi:hypothetical protein ACOSP6_04990 [Tenacibaculum sp. MEBiC06402]|uniref:hypothetical protein n=1 Tax=unclassified Tenacibaculum TaxID=2635139 RepID=UPI003B9D296A
MRRIALSLFFCGFTIYVKSQNISVENSTYGIQTGFLGVWAHNELKLTNSITLRSEIGFDSSIWSGNFYNEVGFLLAPVITMEPRFYYNLNKRIKKSRVINGNSGNFISLKTSYHPDWFVISNTDDVKIISDISIVPTWGIRRSVGGHFTYETGFGIGYRYSFAKEAGYLSNKSDIAVNLHLRIGYRF